METRDGGVRRLAGRDHAELGWAVSEHVGWPRDEEAAQAWLTDERNLAVAAFVDGRPVGLAYGYRLERLDLRPDGLLLYSVDVEEAHRRRGIGTALLEAMRRHAPGGMWLLTNTSNEAAMKLYERAGGCRPNLDDVMWTFPAE